jgi:trimeric autotransporter adhesin
MKRQNNPFDLHRLRALRFIALVSGFLIVLILFAHRVDAQAVLIKDVNTLPEITYPEYSDFVSGSTNKLYFVSQGKELWATDGTAAGTIKYKTLNAISNLAMVGTTLFFVGDGDLWKCVGSPANISRVKQIPAGYVESDPKELTNVNGVLYFIANDYELWRSDGTAAGTLMLMRFPGINSGISNLTNVNGFLYFSGYDDDHGYELWRSDGTTAGTRMVKDVNPGWEASESHWLLNMNGTLYFEAYSPSTGRALWRSNGTASGTVLVKSFLATTGGPIQITKPGVMGNAMYFFVDNAFWKSTGTSYGTTLVKNGLAPQLDAISALSHSPTPINGRLYFAASGSVWISDGTAAGTHGVAPVTLYTNPQFTAFNGSIYYFDYFFVDEEYTAYVRLIKMNPDGTNTSEIWRTPSYMHDADVPTYVPDLAVVNNFLLFDGIPQKGQGQKLLKLNATADGVVVVKDTYTPTESANPSNFVFANGLVYFKSADAFGQDRSVYRTDGTSAGTFLIKTLGIVWDIFAVGRNVFFYGMSSSNQWQLWKTDGTVTGTLLIKEGGDYATYAGAFFADLNGLLLFSNTRGELWKSDGTVAGTVLMKTFSGINQVISAGTVAYLLIDNAGETELWRTNGMISGTVKIETLQPATGFNTHYSFVGNTTVNGVTFFFGTDSYNGIELWRTTGTSYGTYRIKEIRVNNPTDQYIHPVYPLTIFKDNIYISMIDEDFEYFLYKSNGSASGTVKLKSMNPIVQFIPLENKLLLFPKRANPMVSPDLWISDGTAAGTNPVATISGVQDFYYPLRYEVVDGLAYFENGGLWRTDGSNCGTFPVQTGLSSITAMESIGNNLIFGGFVSYRYGNELYRFNLSSVPAAPCVTATSSAVVAEVSAESEVLFSAPNPFDNDFTLRINSPDDIQTQVRVYTVNGLLVESLSSQPNTNYQLGKDWAPGLYFVRISVGDKTMTRKMVKK